MPHKDKAERAAYQREYRKTPAGIKIYIIGQWRRRGLKGDLDAIYEIYLATTECMKCQDPISGHTKHMDHCHETLEYRAVVCQSCNNGNPLDLTASKNNTSTGIKNISAHSGGYIFQKMIKGKTDGKWFATLDEAVDYKVRYLENLVLRECPR